MLKKHIFRLKATRNQPRHSSNFGELDEKEGCVAMTVDPHPLSLVVNFSYIDGM